MLKKGKRSIAFLLLLVMCAALLPTAAFADGEWADGKIELSFGWVDPNDFRDSMQAPRGRSISWNSLPYDSSGAAELLDSEGNVVESYTGQAQHVFKNLKAGEYTIRLTVLDKGYFHIVKSIVNGGPIPHLIDSEDSANLKVTITEGNAETIKRWVVLEYKAYGFKTVTDRGVFENGTDTKVYFEGRNWHFDNTDPSRVDTNPTFNTHNGIYYGDSAGLYAGMNDLEIPTLSQQDIDEGYEFVGWRLEGDVPEKLYTTDEALSIRVRENIVLHAVFSKLSHTVTWKNGDTVLETDENVKVGTAPEYNGSAPQRSRDGKALTFIGWSKNPNAVSGVAAEDLQKVTEDVTYYAVFQEPSSGGTGGGTDGRDGKGIDRIEKTGRDNTGDIYTIFYTDGSTYQFVIPNGQYAIAVPAMLNGEDHFEYIVGYPDGTVRPNGKITRAEVAMIFFRLLKDDVREAAFTKQNSFVDVSEGMWFNTAVSTMANLGIVKGYPDGSFRPNENITRAEFAAIAARFDPDGYGRAVFTDIFGHWAAKSIGLSARNGWISGYPDGSFRPDQAITRAETMSLVNRMLVRDPRDVDDLDEDMIVWPDNMNTKAWYYLDVQEATNGHDHERRERSTEKWTELREPVDWAALSR